ncbi:MAG: hypothetical protein HYZ25_02865 [Chloroflexi bacterium]|nr:hypothetical protein [Chloroflexota bacterium]
MKRFPWLALFLLIAGAGLGILYAWVIAPAPFKDTSPNTLRADFKDDLRSLIAAAYASNGDLERARARLALLGDSDPLAVLNAQAQRMLADGDSFEEVQQVAQLAADLQQPPLAATEPTRPSFTTTPILVVTLPGDITPESTGTFIPEQVIEPPATVSTPTPRPTRTPTPEPGRAYELTAQDTLCEAGLQEGLLQILVTDSRRRPAPGVEIIVTWDGGEEHFFTGFKPELGNGYADFVMQAGIVYTVRVGAGSATVTNVALPGCTSADGVPYIGVIRLSFQQQ